jgi:proline iminopeptidase
MWEKRLVQTSRGEFEIFIMGTGEPLCATHLYSEFNELGSYFADSFVNHFQVILVNLNFLKHQTTPFHAIVMPLTNFHFV